MGYRFPYSVATLSSTGARPINGRPVHAVHFNRMFQEVTALEGAIGPNPHGTQASLKARLAVAMNDDGTYKKELVCEDDPSGNQRGTCRYLYSTEYDVEFIGGGGLVTAEGIIPLHYTAFDEPPVVIVCAMETAFSDTMARMQLKAVSEVGATIDCRTFNNSSGAGGSNPVIAVAISTQLKVFEEDVAWFLPPARTGV